MQCRTLSLHSPLGLWDCDSQRYELDVVAGVEDADVLGLLSLAGAAGLDSVEAPLESDVDSATGCELEEWLSDELLFEA